MNIRIISFFILILALQSRVISAQSETSAIYGKVTDDKKKPLDFATVKAFDGEVLKGGCKTDSNGNYEIGPLMPGTYNLKVEYIGMTPMLISDIPLGNGSRRKVDLELEKSLPKPPTPRSTRRTICIPLIDASDPCTKVLRKNDLKCFPAH